MCIAVYKPADLELPSDETLNECWWANPQGAGFAWYDEETELWTINKGFMTWDEYLQAWHDKDDDVGFYERQVITHFRIGTSGKMNGDCTHPFPISNEQHKLDAHVISSPNVVMHNGVVGPGDGDLSDTQVAIRDDIDLLASLLSTDERAYDMLDRVLKSSSCRWMVGIGSDMWTWGKWHIDEGIYYSNTGYKLSEQQQKKYTGGKPRPKPSAPKRGHASIRKPGTVHQFPTQANTPNGGKTVNTEVGSVGKTGVHECEIVMISDKDVVEILDSNGEFHWAYWKTFCLSISSNKEEKKEDTGYEIIEVYANGEQNQDLLLLVSEDGEVLWDIEGELDDTGVNLTPDIEENDDDDEVMLAVCHKCRFTIIDYDTDDDDGICPECGSFFMLCEMEEYEEEEHLSQDDGSPIYWCNQCSYNTSLRYEKNKCPNCSDGEMVLQETSYECTVCKVEFLESNMLTPDQCPTCGNKVRSISQIPRKDADLVCPHCTERRYLIDSTEPAGDSECCRCGSVWDSSHKKPKVIMYKADVRNVFDQNQAIQKKTMKGGI